MPEIASLRSPSLSPENLPTDWGPLRIERLLGTGGAGEVYLAFDHRLERRVAVKKVRSDRARPNRRSRLRREARAAARLSHPSIVQIYEWIESEDGDWIVMEWVRGEGLDRVLTQGSLGPSRAVGWAIQIARGLAEAHARGLVHRDLKAENVIAAESGVVKILDFGLARDLEPEDTDVLTRSGAVLGTVRTMSPEQVRGLEAGPRADLFSMGVLLYEMLTGSSPFARKGVAATLHAIVAESPEPLPAEIPPRLTRLVERMLAKAPELRPTSAAEVADELQGILLLLDDSAPSDSSELRSLTTQDASESRRLPRLAPAARSLRKAWAIRVALPLSAAVLLALLVAHVAPTHPPSQAVIERTGLLSPDIDTAFDSSDFEALSERGWQALERYDLPGRIDEATALFQRLLEVQPDSAIAHAGLARAYLLRHRQDSADPMWLRQAQFVARRAVELDPGSAEVQTSLGMVLARSGSSEVAQAAFEEALALQAEDAEAHLGLARLHLDAGRLDEAERRLEQAIVLRPDDRRIFDNLGTLLYRRGELERAEEAFRRSIELTPDGVQGLRNLATVLIARDRLDEAVSVLQRALSIRKSASLYINLGTVRFFQGLYPQAAEAFRDALDQPAGSTYYLTWANLGDAYRQIPHRQEDAQLAYQKAVELLRPRQEKSPGNERLHTQLALYLARAGDIEAASRQLETGEPPKEARSYFRTAMAWEVIGRRDLAFDSLRRALDLGLAREEIEREPELLALRTDARYQFLE